MFICHEIFILLWLYFLKTTIFVLLTFWSLLTWHLHLPEHIFIYPMFLITQCHLSLSVCFFFFNSHHRPGLATPPGSIQCKISKPLPCSLFSVLSWDSSIEWPFLEDLILSFYPQLHSLHFIHNFLIVILLSYSYFYMFFHSSFALLEDNHYDFFSEVPNNGRQ